MLTYPQIKDLCKHAGEAMAICPVNYKRCTACNCPLFDTVVCTNDLLEQKKDLDLREEELEEERKQLERWSGDLQNVVDHYRDLDSIYNDNANLVKSTFADFTEALKNGAKKVNEAKQVLKDDFLFIHNYYEL